MNGSSKHPLHDARRGCRLFNTTPIYMFRKKIVAFFTKMLVYAIVLLFLSVLLWSDMYFYMHVKIVLIVVSASTRHETVFADLKMPSSRDWMSTKSGRLFGSASQQSRINAHNSGHGMIDSRSFDGLSCSSTTLS